MSFYSLIQDGTLILLLYKRTEGSPGACCTKIGLKAVSIRRLELWSRFAKKTATDMTKHSGLFQLKDETHETRSDILLKLA